MKEAIPALIRSFSNGTDYHPAVQGVVIGNEYNREDNISTANVAAFTNTWASIEGGQFGKHRKILMGHPVAFGLTNNKNDCWDAWEKLLPLISALNSRLFLAPQTYNPASDLFHNYRGTNKGYVDLTSINSGCRSGSRDGLDRTKDNHVNIVTGQLEGCINYNKQNPSKLIGCACFPISTNLAEGKQGAFGTWTHARPGATKGELYGQGFHASDMVPNSQPPKAISLGNLNIDHLEKADLYEAVTKAYKT